MDLDLTAAFWRLPIGQLSMTTQLPTEKRKTRALTHDRA